jgi:hypothetical protein
MSLTYILIDFENVKPPASDIKLIRGADFRVRIISGTDPFKKVRIISGTDPFKKVGYSVI